MKRSFQRWWYGIALAIQAPSLTVCPDCSLKSIRQAIEASRPGATITVKSGVYREGHLVIQHPLKLIGEGQPVLDGEGKSEILTLWKTPDVEVAGFVIRNTGFSYTQEWAGIKAESSDHCFIHDNRLEETSFGIYLADSTGCRVENNQISGIVRGEADTGNGIHLWKGGKHQIRGNRVSKHRDGIYLEFIQESQIEKNDVSQNLRYGLHFMSSHQNSYLANSFYKNGAGVAVMYSHRVTMKQNTFRDNLGPAAYGLLLKDISDSVIEENEFSHNNMGVYMEGSNRGKFMHNRFVGNGWGLKIMADCESNDFRENSFSKNTFDVTTNGTQVYNTFDHNYWSSYSGYDMNGDGVGDQPFRLVSLSSIVLERVDSSFPLLRSFLFDLMDQVERAMPELIPERLVDEHPKMKP